MAGLGWSADQFWSATPHGLWAAIEGWQELNRKPD